MGGSVLPFDRVGRDLDQLRAQAPLVHCLTNVVVAGFTANALLAAGAAPAMVLAVEEAGEFAAQASAVLVNLGTVTEPTAQAMRAAVAAAGSSGVPWVLDPVAVGAVGFRTALAGELLAAGPTVVRGNASEILTLAGVDHAVGRGVESTAAVQDAVPAAQRLAQRHGVVVALSGATDYLTDGASVVPVPGGDALLTRITGAGCALGALVAAFVAVDPEPLWAAVAASTVWSAAAEQAARTAHGPGHFAAALLDALYGLDHRALAER